jgi:hypothetical protein
MERAGPLTRAVGYSFKQVIEMLLPAGTVLLAGFVAFTDFREETRRDIDLLKLTQDVTERQVQVTQEAVRRQSDSMHGQKEQLAVIDERTERTEEDVKEIKGLLNEAVRQLRETR